MPLLSKRFGRYGHFQKSEMVSRNVIHRIVALVVNLLLVVLLFYKVITIHSDKAPLLVFFYYPLLTLANLILWLALRKQKPIYAQVYKQTFVGLLLLFVPAVYLT